MGVMGEGLSRREWLIRGAIKATGRLAFGYVATVVLVGGPLPHRLIEWAEERDRRRRVVAEAEAITAAADRG